MDESYKLFFFQLPYANALILENFLVGIIALINAATFNENI
jgi:hypothetical protein